jgi:hypothetical protein
LNGKNMMDEHEAHLAHLKEENGGETPERVVYVSFVITTLPRLPLSLSLSILSQLKSFFRKYYIPSLAM